MADLALSIGASRIPSIPNALSRRAAMASTVAAFSLLPGAAMATSLAGHPDAELIELGRQLMPLFEEHAGRIGELGLPDQRLRAMWPKQPETLRATEADIELMGGPETGAGTHWTDWAIKQKMETHPDKPAVLARCHELLGFYAVYERDVFQAFADSGHNDATERLNEVVDRIDTVIARIRKTPAKTLEGLAVKALALQFGAPDLWREDPHDMDWDQCLIAELANEILGHLPFEGTRYASA
jgi:hypothetical protein